MVMISVKLKRMIITECQNNTKPDRNIIESAGASKAYRSGVSKDKLAKQIALDFKLLHRNNISNYSVTHSGIKRNQGNVS